MSEAFWIVHGKGAVRLSVRFLCVSDDKFGLR